MVSKVSSLLMLSLLWAFYLSAQTPQSSLKMKLSQIEQPVIFTKSYWMNSSVKLIKDPKESTRVVKVEGRLSGKIPITIDFSKKDSVSYLFGEGLKSFTVHTDSMPVYYNRKKGKEPGKAPEWHIGSIRNGETDYAVWVSPDANTTCTQDSLLFLNSYRIMAVIGNVYEGETTTGNDPLKLKIFHSMENAGFDYNPTIIPDGKYEDFSNYRPDIINGLITTKERGIGSIVQTGSDEYYRIDSITPDYGNLILSHADCDIKKTELQPNAKEELKPYLEKVASGGKLLLIDFWGTWCRPCIAALPQLKEIEGKYADKILVLSVINDQPDNFERGKQILDKHGLKSERLFREKEPLVRLLQVQAFPTYFLLNSDGDIIMKGASAQALDWLDNYLESKSH